MIDLQVNGAFGVDLFRAGPESLGRMARGLSRAGVQAFLPTLITAPEPLWWRGLGSLGSWVASQRRLRNAPGARPLGLHLEGPFLNPRASGVHPGTEMQRATPDLLDRIWRESFETVRLMTVAPEVHTREELVALVRWARVRDVRLSVGHSVATYEQARAAFDLGFSGVTHAWNAGRFHHREPGVLGAAVGRDDVHLMVIPDLVHCHRAAVEWLLRMHPPRRLVFVSDCAPIAGQPEGATSEFGSFQVQMRNGEARLMGASAGDLAGAGALLPAAVRRFKKASAWARAQKPLQWRRWCSENARRWLATR